MEAFITGRRLAAEIRSGNVTSVDAVQFYIDRIEKLDLKSTTNQNKLDKYQGMPNADTMNPIT